MSLNESDKRKIFYILVSIVIGTAVSGTMAWANSIDAKYAELKAETKSNALQLAQNDVPSLKYQINESYKDLKADLKIIKAQGVITNQHIAALEAEQNLQKKLFCIAYMNLCT